VLKKVRGKAFKIVFEKKDLEEVLISPLNRDVPGQDDRRINHDTRPPNSFPNQTEIAPDAREYKHDAKCQTGSNRSLCQSTNGKKEIKVEEPELLSRFEPSIPP